MSEERLQKLMARAGLGSRRACEEIIREGRVEVNGRLAKLGDKADPVVDKIRVDGVPLKMAEPPTTIALYKPKHALSTDAPHHKDRRPTARSFIPLDLRLFPIGRLDADSEGLMLFTNDGELANRLAHPRYEHDKEYRVLVTGRPSEEALRKWRRGIQLEDGKTAPAQVTLIEGDKHTTWLRITMKEGRKRQIRRIALALGHPVRKLVRERIGPVHLGQLKPQEWRPLSKKELKALRELRQDRARPKRRR
jgi:pseudouridine synthase